MRVFSNIINLNMHIYVFLYQSFLCSVTFYDVSLHFNAHACTHVSDARAIYIMQIDFAEFCRGQSVTAAKHA